MAVDLLDSRLDLGSVRCQDYSVENVEWYSKELNGKKTKVRQRQVNNTTREKAVYKKIDSGVFYETNLSTVLCGLTRIDAMTASFDKLKEMNNFTEHHFMAEYFNLYKNIALIEGGIYEPSDDSVGIGGFWASGGYISTATGASIIDIGSEDICNVC